MTRVIKGGTKAEFSWHANSVGNCTVVQFSIVMENFPKACLLRPGRILVKVLEEDRRYEGMHLHYQACSAQQLPFLLPYKSYGIDGYSLTSW